MSEDRIEPRHPEAEVDLRGIDSNAFAIIAATSRALRKAGVSKEELASFYEDAQTGDYEAMIRTVQSWVTVV